MQTLAPVDVVIVGGGWTGMVMAKEIATRTTLSVLLLERGGAFRGPAAYSAEMDEVDTFIRKRHAPNPADGVFTTRASYSDRANPIRQYGEFPPWGTGMGGSGDHWGATSPRFMPEAFEIASHLKAMHGASRLPPGNLIQDYGLTWKDMEPYYTRAEQMMGTSGKAGNLNGKKIEGGNVFEGPRSREFPNPPHPMLHAPQLFAKAAKELGYHPFPMPSSTLSRNYVNPDGIGRVGCQYCGHCSGFGCMVGAKASPNFTLLPIVQTTKNFKLRTDCQVRRVVHKGGKATGVTYVDESGNEFMQPAEAVVLATWVFNNARLLMLSGIGRQYDPVTAKGTLGKNCTYAVHVGLQLFLDKPQNIFMGSGGMAMGIGDFGGDLGAEGAAQGAFRGGLIFCYTQGDPPVISAFGVIPDGEVRQNWGSQWKNAAMKWHDRYALFLSTENHFPYRQNYLDLDPTYRDKWGDPLLRVTMDWTEAERKQAAFISRKQVEIARAMGAVAINPRPNPSLTSGPPLMVDTHSHGGAIMGASPDNSVVNPYLQHWNMPNLWVVGGSALPQGEEHLTLTVTALAYRAADAFVERYVRRPGALA
ncbi:MAG TPA: GMC family oxidoreductase [Bryobacteraceae bacterium]